VGHPPKDRWATRLEKLARLGKTETVLKQLEEIRPEPQRVRIDVASTTDEYTYDLETFAA
jgi:hypothetical protein